MGEGGGDEMKANIGKRLSGGVRKLLSLAVWQHQDARLFADASDCIVNYIMAHVKS